MVLCVADGKLAPRGYVAVERHLEDTWIAKLETAETLAETASNRIQSYFPRWRLSCEALWGSPAEVVLKTSSWWRPDLLIVGSHGRSRAGRVFMGSVSLELVHKARCSVRVARIGKSVEGPIRLVIGNDGSTEGEAVLGEVARRAWPPNTNAHVISVFETLSPSELERRPYAVAEQERARLQDVAEDSATSLRRTGLIATGTVIDGDPRLELVREAERWNADTIFVGARGLRGIHRFLLGSVSTAVVTRASCTVEVVRRAS